MKAPENTQMKKATSISILATTVFYLGIAVVGYAAFGDSAPGNLLTGFGFFNPYWLIDLANVFIMVHLLGAYQVCACHKQALLIVCLLDQSASLGHIVR